MRLPIRERNSLLLMSLADHCVKIFFMPKGMRRCKCVTGFRSSLTGNWLRLYLDAQCF